MEEKWMKRTHPVPVPDKNNYRKNRKKTYHIHKQKVQEEIQTIYHEHSGVDGYSGSQWYQTPAKNKLKFPSGRIRAITNRLLNNYIEFVFGGVKWK